MSQETGVFAGALAAIRRPAALAVVVFGLAGPLAACEQETPTATTQRTVSVPAESDHAVAAPATRSEPAAGDSLIRYGSREARPRQNGTIRLATYNVENLFDDKDDPNVNDNPNTPSNEDDASMLKPASERAGLAAAIRAIDADVIAMQEVESKEALLWFRDEYLSGMGYEHVVSIDSGDGRGIENAVLSRFPLEDPEVWPGLPLGGVHPEKWGNGKNYNAGEPIVFRRSPLRVTVHVPADEVAKRTGVASAKAYDVVLFVVHHKAGGGGKYWREAEADKTIELVHEAEAKGGPGEVNVLVLGDFNARVVDESVKKYFRAGMRDPFEGLSRSDPTIQTHTTNRRIDYVLFNEAATGELVGSAWVLGTPMRPDGADWRTTPAPEGYGSDHMPVVVDLRPVDR